MVRCVTKNRRSKLNMTRMLLAVWHPPAAYSQRACWYCLSLSSNEMATRHRQAKAGLVFNWFARIPRAFLMFPDTSSRNPPNYNQQEK
jgi:hypothetical protein